LISILKGGDWAGNVYSASGCPSTCVGMFSQFFSFPTIADVWDIDFVNNNPASFQNAYFDFASIRMYKAATWTPPENCNTSSSDPPALELL
jgi:hypothetical protein